MWNKSYTTFTVQNMTDILKNRYYKSSSHKKIMYRVKGVCIEVLSYGYFKCFLFILKDCQTGWQTDENFDASIK